MAKRGRPTNESLGKPAFDNQEYHAQLMRNQSSKGAEIGELPPVKDPARKERCRKSLLEYLVTYFPNSTGIYPFSQDHLRVISRMEGCIIGGGRHVNSVYRGFAKTTISQLSALWAASYGYRKCTLVVASSQDSSEGILAGVLLELENNDLLLEDFPEICVPIRALEGKVMRCGFQTYGGKRTGVYTGKDTLYLPTIPGAASSGAIIAAYGLAGGVRGVNIAAKNGKKQRPDMAIIDDPQNDGSAHSPIQIIKRLEVIRKGIIQSAGHGKKIAIVLNGTVMRKEDVVDQLLDHGKNPSWQSERIPMVKKWADAHEKHWQVAYRNLRHGYDPHLVGDKERAEAQATVYYAKHRAEMDKGCVVSWEHCYDHESELSAIQHAYNLLLDDPPEVFESEYQQNPDESINGGSTAFTPELIISKATGDARRVVPQWATHLTAFTDVQKDLLYWAVVAWDDHFTGHIVDYGVYPEQQRHYFVLRDALPTLKSVCENSNFEGSIRAGLACVTKNLIEHEWEKPDGSVLHVEKMLIDASWGNSTDIVYDFCRTSGHPTIVQPSHGRGITASGLPMEKWKRSPGEKLGFHYTESNRTGKNRGIKHVTIDVNFWKSFCTQRFTTKSGDTGSLTIFKERRVDHRLFADHMTAEFYVRTQGQGRELDEWKQRPHKPDNHWWDCIVGSACAAAMMGCTLDSSGAVPQRTAKPTTQATQTRIGAPRSSFFITART
ncbi:MAG: terminase gpA endonuclease subunit [Planctomycetota bacterium]